MTEPYRSEKRRHPRHPISSPVRYTEIQSHTKGGSMSVDISEGGICFLAGRFMPRGTSVYFNIPVTDQLFQVEGKTTYSTFLPNVDFYRTGVEFLNPQVFFQKKLTEEIAQIREYQKKLSKELGYEISEKEAAERWVNDCAKHFSYSF